MSHLLTFARSKPASQVHLLNDLLELSSFCSAAVTMPIIDISSSMVCDYDDGRAAHIAGRCMRTISQREAVEWADKINLGLWMKKCVEKWAWVPDVLEGLFALAQAKFGDFRRAFPSLISCLVLRQDCFLLIRYGHFYLDLFCLIQDDFD